MKPPVTKLKYCARSDIGLVRHSNEDAYAIGGGQSDEYPGSLFVVCDGMGGLSAGDVAAQLAAETIINAYYVSTEHDRKKSLIEALQAANQQVYQQEHGKSGATAVTALFVMGKLFIAHAGNCRAYQFHKKRLRQITEDHLLTTKLIHEGVITRESLLHHTHTERIVRIVGQANGLEVNVAQGVLKKTDALLLASDGLHGQLDNQQIEDVLRKVPYKYAADRLIELANACGGRDNITVILIWREE